MTKKRLLLISDSYWPVRGGMEQAEYLFASFLGPEYSLTIATHSREPRGSLLDRTIFLRKFDAYKDPSGNMVIPLVPSLLGRIMMFPLALWNLPFVRRLSASRAYDRLYRFYRNAFQWPMAELVQNADLVHCYSTNYSARLTSDLCNRRHIPLVCTPAIHFGRWGDSAGQMNAYGNADAAICFTGYFRQRMKDAWKQPVKASLEVIPPASGRPRVNLPEHAAVRKPYILFLGRREEHKGLRMLLDALREPGPPVPLVIAGPGKKFDNKGDEITDLGEVDDTTKAQLLAHCELLCVPSTDETFGIVYTEAMSYGKPVVALDIPPVNEIVLDGQTGLLVEPGDVGALRMALARVLGDEALRMRMGENGRRRFTEHYSDQVILDKIKRLYSGCWGPKSGVHFKTSKFISR